MSIKGIIYSNQTVSAADHAALFRMVISDGILDGCGCSTRLNEFTISSGMFITAGRSARIVGSEKITIPNDGTYGEGWYAQIVLVSDMNRTAEVDQFNQVYFDVKYAHPASGESPVFPALVQEDINANGQKYEVEWAKLTLGANGNIVSYTQTITNSEGGGGGSEVTYITENLFEYSDGQSAGNYEYYGDGSENWEIALLNTGSLKFLANPGLVDVFLVGSGGTGVTGYYDAGLGHGGSGGKGGECRTFESLTISRNNPYSIIIGENGANTEAFDNIAYGGNDNANWSSDYGKTGGTGSWTNTSSGGGTVGAGTQGVLAFYGANASVGTNLTSFNGAYFGSSGGGAGTSHGTPTSGWTSQPGAVGGIIIGTTRAGQGGSADSSANNGTSPSVSNSGAGGGGGAYALGSAGASSSYGLGGAGSSGIVIIRNHRTPAA